ncbi:MAG: TMEM165/GDT1 family protein [Jatrophihabitantaceae bacterium]
MISLHAGRHGLRAISVAELPDKTAVVGLVLGTRSPWPWVSPASPLPFTANVAFAMASGSLLTVLPRRRVEAIVAALALLGAALVWRDGAEDESEGRPRSPKSSTPRDSDVSRVPRRSPQAG